MIGIKKTLGVTPIALLSFCLLEAAVFVCISLIIALLASALLLPYFNSVFESRLSADYFLKLKVVGLIAGVLLLSGAVVASVAVIKQWRMKPVNLMQMDPEPELVGNFLFGLGSLPPVFSADL